MIKNRKTEIYYSTEKKLLYKKRKQINNNFYLKTEKRFSRRKLTTINYKKYKYFCFYLFTIFIIIIISHKFIYQNWKGPLKSIKINKLDKNEIKYVFKENFPNLQDSFNNAKDFLDKCLSNSLINNETIKNVEESRVSVIIPIYNCNNTILRAIRSIQNQNISDFEIILVNDFSTDGTLSIVEQIQKKDPRIKIINNQKNMGTLYSRSIAALSAKGKYIFNLDNDDMFLDKDVFWTITNFVDKYNLDIVGFRAIYSCYGPNILTNKIKDNNFSNQTEDHILLQPELGLYPIRPDYSLKKYELFDSFLWTKCIKTNVYQKALNKLGEEKYSRYMVIWEDVVSTFFLYNTAESMKYIGKYGVLHIKTIGSGSKKKISIKEMNSYNLYLIDTAIEFSKDTFENRKILVALINDFFKKKQLEETLKSNDYNKKLLISCLDKILNMKHISDENRKKIRKRASKLKLLKL